MKEKLNMDDKSLEFSVEELVSNDIGSFDSDDVMDDVVDDVINEKVDDCDDKDF